MGEARRDAARGIGRRPELAPERSDPLLGRLPLHQELLDAFLELGRRLEAERGLVGVDRLIDLADRLERGSGATTEARHRLAVDFASGERGDEERRLAAELTRRGREPLDPIEPRRRALRFARDRLDQGEAREVERELDVAELALRERHRLLEGAEPLGGLRCKLALDPEDADELRGARRRSVDGIERLGRGELVIGPLELGFEDRPRLRLLRIDEQGLGGELHRARRVAEVVAMKAREPRDVRRSIRRRRERDLVGQHLGELAPELLLLEERREAGVGVAIRTVLGEERAPDRERVGAVGADQRVAVGRVAI